MLLVGDGRLVGEESVELLRRGRKAGEIEGETAEERGFFGFETGLELVLFETGEDEAIDVRTGPLFELNGWNGRSFGRKEAPVLLPVCALFDPAFEG